MTPDERMKQAYARIEVLEREIAHRREHARAGRPKRRGAFLALGLAVASFAAAAAFFWVTVTRYDRGERIPASIPFEVPAWSFPVPARNGQLVIADLDSDGEEEVVSLFRDFRGGRELVAWSMRRQTALWRTPLEPALDVNDQTILRAADDVIFIASGKQVRSFAKANGVRRGAWAAPEPPAAICPVAEGVLFPSAVGEQGWLLGGKGAAASSTELAAVATREVKALRCDVRESQLPRCGAKIEAPCASYVPPASADAHFAEGLVRIDDRFEDRASLVLVGEDRQGEKSAVFVDRAHARIVRSDRLRRADPEPPRGPPGKVAFANGKLGYAYVTSRDEWLLVVYDVVSGREVWSRPLAGPSERFLGLGAGRSAFYLTYGNRIEVLTSDDGVPSVLDHVEAAPETGR